MCDAGQYVRKDLQNTLKTTHTDPECSLLAKLYIHHYPKLVPIANTNCVLQHLTSNNSCSAFVPFNNTIAACIIIELIFLKSI